MDHRPKVTIIHAKKGSVAVSLSLKKKRNIEEDRAPTAKNVSRQKTVDDSKIKESESGS